MRCGPSNVFTDLKGSKPRRVHVCPAAGLYPQGVAIRAANAVDAKVAFHALDTRLKSPRSTAVEESTKPGRVSPSWCRSFGGLPHTWGDEKLPCHATQPRGKAFYCWPPMSTPE